MLYENLNPWYNLGYGGRVEPPLAALRANETVGGSSYSYESVMSYSTWSKDHKHIQPRPVHIPAWGALTIPHRWMLKESGFQIAKNLERDTDPEREPRQSELVGKNQLDRGFHEPGGAA